MLIVHSRETKIGCFVALPQVEEGREGGKRCSCSRKSVSSDKVKHITLGRGTLISHGKMLSVGMEGWGDSPNHQIMAHKRLTRQNLEIIYPYK